MGQDLSMIVHVCGMDTENPHERSHQIDLINLIFTEQNSKENTSNYEIRYSKKPKWKAYI
jgi:hypothetical protein